MVRRPPTVAARPVESSSSSDPAVDDLLRQGWRSVRQGQGGVRRYTLTHAVSGATF
eukprot:gene23256-64271_t